MAHLAHDMTQRRTMKAEIENVYMVMPLAIVRVDAEAGLSLARAALRQRDAAAARTMGIGISAEQQARGTLLANEERENSLSNSEKARKSR